MSGERHVHLRVRRVTLHAEGPVGIEEACRACGLPPEALRRLIGAGLVEAVEEGGESRLAPSTAAQLARAARLQRDLGVGWPGALLAAGLLARIEALEERLRGLEPPPS